MTEPQTVVKLDPSDLSPMQREVNRGLMVWFINAELIERAALDLKKSFVFYDADKNFLYALDFEPNEAQLKQLRASTAIRFYSKGC